MKLLKRFILLSFITVIALYAIFFYINRYILSTANVKIQSQKIDTMSVTTNIYVKIPESAVNIKVSYDGAFVAYEDNQGLNIVDTKIGQKNQTNLGYGVSYYEWLPDRNRILIVRDYKKNFTRKFKLDYYDADRDEQGNVSELKAFDTTTEIKDLKVSTITNSIYIKAEDNDSRAKIYYLNIMKKLKKIKTKDNNIGDIEVVPNKSNMVYEDNSNGKIYYTNIGKPIVLNNSKSQNLLGMDNEDNVYIGETVNNKIVNIYSGSLDTTNIVWHLNELNAPVNKSDVYIPRTGGIYINIGLENSLFNVSTHEFTSYPGKLLQVIDDAIVSIDHQKLMITKLKRA
jgi:hypothetical protein